jgi:glucuronoarabinoxylan endo-1,4-beta-xylanase
MAIDTTANARDLLIKLPYQVKSGQLWLSTGNEPEKLCQKSDVAIDEPTNEILVEMPARSLSTYIFMIDRGSTAIQELTTTSSIPSPEYYDLHGRRLDKPRGLCIEKTADGRTKKIMMGR